MSTFWVVLLFAIGLAFAAAPVGYWWWQQRRWAARRTITVTPGAAANFAEGTRLVITSMNGTHQHAKLGLCTTTPSRPGGFDRHAGVLVQDGSGESESGTADGDEPPIGPGRAQWGDDR